MNLKEGRTTVKDVVLGGHSKGENQNQKVKQYHKEPKDELICERMGKHEFKNSRRTHCKHMTNISSSQDVNVTTGFNEHTSVHDLLVGSGAGAVVVRAGPRSRGTARARSQPGGVLTTRSPGHGLPVSLAGRNVLVLSATHETQQHRHRRSTLEQEESSRHSKPCRCRWKAARPALENRALPESLRLVLILCVGGGRPMFYQRWR